MEKTKEQICKHKYPDVLLIGDYPDDKGFFIRLCHCINCGIFGYRQSLKSYIPEVEDDFFDFKTTNKINRMRIGIIKERRNKSITALNSGLKKSAKSMDK